MTEPAKFTCLECGAPIYDPKRYVYCSDVCNQRALDDPRGQIKPRPELEED